MTLANSIFDEFSAPGKASYNKKVQKVETALGRGDSIYFIHLFRLLAKGRQEKRERESTMEQHNSHALLPTNLYQESKTEKPVLVLEST